MTSDQARRLQDSTVSASSPWLGLATTARLLPGIVLCAAITLAAIAAQSIEETLFGYPYIETVVLAILIGTAIRTIWTPSLRWQPGVTFCARILLELAVGLLGASVSITAIAGIGPALVIGVTIVVFVTLLASYYISRSIGLTLRLAILVASGNSICGNSAIAAVAPIVGADSKEVASAIAFTAVLGVIAVLGLPLLVPLLHLSQVQYGAVAGLTVYAVPQVLAATLPIGATSNQIGTVVKLIRVLMLGPLVLALSLIMKYRRGTLTGETHPSIGENRRRSFSPFQFVPWFIFAFATLAILRTTGSLPQSVIHPAIDASKWLTVISMTALGLGVDVHTVASAGHRTTAAVTISLLILLAMSLALIHVIHIA